MARLVTLTSPLLLLLALVPSASHAEGSAVSSEEARSKALFAEGRELAAAGQHDQACPKFEEALRHHVGIGIQFNLADCWEHIGRTASAHALFLGVAASSHAAGQSEREQLARERALALEPRLSHLLIEVASKDAELVVRRDHTVVDPKSYGLDQTVDPGSYTIEASEPGKKSWSTQIDVQPLTTKPVTVKVPELEPEQKPDAVAAAEPDAQKKAPKAAACAAKPAEKHAAARPQVRHRSSVNTAYAIALTTLGVAGVGAGTMLGLEYRSTNRDAMAICPTSLNCSQKQMDDHAGLVDNARMFRTWSYISFGLGGAALLGGAAFFFLPGVTTHGDQRAWSAAPFVTADRSWGLSANGSF